MKSIKQINKEERIEKLRQESLKQAEENAIKEKQNDEYRKKLHKEKIEIKKGEYKTEKKKSKTYKHKFMPIEIGIAVAFAAIGAVLVWNLFSKEKYDLTVLVLIRNAAIEDECDDIAEYFTQFADDFNDDGEVTVNAFYIPVTSANDDMAGVNPGQYLADSGNLSIQLERYDNLIIIADSNADDYVMPEYNLYDLAYEFDDELSDEFIKDKKFHISKSKLKEKIGYGYYFSDDAYIGLRLAPEKDKENFQTQLEIIKKVINDLS
ncbi:MAG: hypothetical protein LBM93_13110 [Oscillospiraceae bacterium]|jgi:hypothetical protein|nr:hypothetical protein [Oscillospiraceae bacterium]